MAAIDIVYNTDSPALFTPDYSFLRYNLDKKQARYDQGLDAVSRAYNNLKRDVTDPTNAQTRDQFLKDAQAQLQKIASADLSLPENVYAANNVFEPLATNPAFLFDAYHTKRINNELAEMKGWSEASDMETRKKFNPKIYNWVASQLDYLKEGNGNIDNYKKMPSRSAFAYVDPQDIVNQAVKDTGATFSKEIDGGVYVYGTENGVTFRKNYKEFAKQVLESNPVYKQQASILGESDYESLIKQGKSLGKSDQETLMQFGDNNYSTIKTNRTKYLDDLKEDINKRGKDLIAQVNSIDASTPEGQAKLQKIAEEKAKWEQDKVQYDALRSDYQNQFGVDDKSTEEKKQTYIKNFLSNPKGFIAQQYEDNDINTFSNIRSTFEKTTVKPNTAYFNTLSAVNNAQRTNNDILKGIENTQIKEEAQDLNERKQAWLEAGKPVSGKTFGTTESGVETVTTINADGTLSTSKKPKKPELAYVGPSGVDITKKLSTINAIGSQLNLKTAKSISLLASGSDGGALSILNTMGVNRENIQAVREYFIKYQQQAVVDPNKPYKADPSEYKALQDVYSSLFAFAKKENNEEVLKKLRQEYGKPVTNIDFHNLLDIAISQTKFKDEKDWNYVNQWNEHKKTNEDIRSLSNILKTSKDAVIAYVNSNDNTKQEFKDVIIQKDGKPQLIDAETIAKMLPKKGWKENVNWSVDPEVTLTNEDIKNITEGYINGTIKVDLKRVANVDNIFDRDIGAYVKYQGRELYLTLGASNNQVFNAFPLTTEQLQKKFEKINSKIELPEIGDQFKEELLASPIWNLSGGMKDKVLTSLVPVTQYSSNIMVSSDGNKFEQVEDADDQVKMRGALANPKNIAENGVYIHSKSNSNAGGISVAVTFADADTKEEKADCVYCGKTVYFPINVVKGTPEVLQVFNTINDETEYNRIKNSGKIYDMYNYDAMGIKVQILPHTKGSATGDVIITTQKQDPVTKQFIPGEYETIQNRYTLETQTYDQLKEEVYNKLVNPFIVNRIALEKQTSTKTAGAVDIKGQILKGISTIQ